MEMSTAQIPNARGGTARNPLWVRIDFGGERHFRSDRIVHVQRWPISAHLL